jgi:hypothetical protein
MTLTATAINLTGAVTGTSFAGVGTSLTALNAANLGSGTVPIGRLGISGTPDSTTFLRGDNTWVNAVTSVSVVTANGVSATVANQSSSPALTITLAAITPTTVTATGVITADSFIATGNTAPAVGIYEGSAAGGISISTSSTERFSVTSAGLITNRSAVASLATAVAASAVNCSLGNYFTKTYSGALTWTFTNVPAGFYRFVLRLIRGANGTQTWPSTVKWTGGSAPGLTGTNGGSDIVEFLTDDGGASWRAYRLTTTTT